MRTENNLAIRIFRFQLCYNMLTKSFTVMFLNLDPLNGI